jgi:hypothetical protein
MSNSSLQLVIWQARTARCELWMSAGMPELRLFVGETLQYKERAPLESLYDRAEQLRWRRPPTR